MSRSNLGSFLALLLVIISSICEAAIFHRISDSHRSAARDIFKPIGGSFKSLEDAYEALRTFEILGIGKDLDISTSTCILIMETIKSTSASLKEVNFALKSNQVLTCKIDGEDFKAVSSRLQAAISEANSLLDYYYSIQSLLLLKDQAAHLKIQLEKSDEVFRSVKALGQSDGRWRYNSNKPESSTRAAGIALETLAGVVSLASADIDQSLIGALKNDIVKLFDSMEKYDDGVMFFDMRVVDEQEYEGPLSTTSSVVRGLVAFSDVTSGKIAVSGNKILGLAKYFLGIGVPGNSHDFFNLIDALVLLESNRVSIPLILSLPASVLSITRNDQLKVKVTTVLGSKAPSLTVKIVQAASVDSKNSPVIENQDLKYDGDADIYVLDALPKDVDVGQYEFVFKIALNDPSQNDICATGGQTWVKVYVTGKIEVENADISVLDSDLGNVESQKQQLTSPLGNAFRPHQDFLGLVDKLYYLSGKYDIQLTVGDASMENSFSRSLGHIDLDLPDAPEKATRPPLQPVNPLSRFGPKEEISHMFRTPEKRPPKELSLAFLGLTFIPLVGFLIGLLRLGVNFKNFPTSTVPAAFAALFHVGIAAVLCLYVLFWLKLNLFTTLKFLSFLGVFLVFVGHRTLSHLASTSAKSKAT